MQLGVGMTIGNPILGRLSTSALRGATGGLDGLVH
jgi:hypothetical protein